MRQQTYQADMNFLRITVIMLGITLTAVPISSAAADDADKARQLAAEYSNAQARGDRALKAKLYDQIVEDKAVLERIRKDYRDTYNLMKLQSTERRLDRMQSRYGTRRPQTRAAPSTGILQTGAGVRASVGSDSGAPDSNRTYTQNFANKDREPNRVRSAVSNSRIRATNSDFSRSFSNRSRAREQSNQRRLRRRR